MPFEKHLLVYGTIWLRQVLPTLFFNGEVSIVTAMTGGICEQAR